MQTHNLKSKTKRITSKQLGRGQSSGKGKTAGRGTKGQNARSGRKIRPEFRDVIKRLPKMRGRGKNSNKTIKSEYPVEIRLTVVENSFDNGDKVSIKTLKEKGLVELRKGKLPKVKVLGGGELTKKLSFNGLAVTSSAKAVIEKAGGTVTE